MLPIKGGFSDYAIVSITTYQAHNTNDTGFYKHGQRRYLMMRSNLILQQDAFHVQKKAKIAPLRDLTTKSKPSRIDLVTLGKLLTATN